MNPKVVTVFSFEDLKNLNYGGAGGNGPVKKILPRIRVRHQFLGGKMKPIRLSLTHPAAVDFIVEVMQEVVSADFCRRWDASFHRERPEGYNLIIEIGDTEVFLFGISSRPEEKPSRHSPGYPAEVEYEKVLVQFDALGQSFYIQIYSPLGKKLDKLILEALENERDEEKAERMIDENP